MDTSSVAGETLRPLFSALAQAQARARRWKPRHTATHADLVVRSRTLLARVGLSLVVERSSFERSEDAGSPGTLLARTYHLVHEDGSRLELDSVWPLGSQDEAHVEWVVGAMTAHLMCDLLLVDAAKHHAPPPLEGLEAIFPVPPHTPTLDGHARRNGRNGFDRGGA